MAGHDTVGIIPPIRVFIIFIDFFCEIIINEVDGSGDVVDPVDFRHWGFSGERSNHTTATELCPDMGRCGSWHTSGGVVLHPHQLAGGEIRGTYQGHGGLPC